MIIYRSIIRIFYVFSLHFALAMTKEEQAIKVNGEALAKLANETILGVQNMVPKVIEWLNGMLGGKVGNSSGVYESVWQNPKVIIPVIAFFLFVLFGTAFIIMAKYVLRKKKSNKHKKGSERISKYDSAAQPQEEEAIAEPFMPQLINQVPVLYPSMYPTPMVHPQMLQQQMMHQRISQPLLVHGQMPQYQFQPQQMREQSEHQQMQQEQYEQEQYKQKRFLQEQLLQEQLQEEQYDDEKIEQERMEQERWQEEQLSKERMRQERWLQEQLLREQYEQDQCGQEQMQKSEKKGIGKTRGRKEKYDSNRENEGYKRMCRKEKGESREGKDKKETEGNVIRNERKGSTENNERERKYKDRSKYEHVDLNNSAHYIGYSPIQK
ncbi:hypothetical protein PCOAH_00023480 [Plasmodium coatneyi]|uniref:Uncharacterized protein n=1 Tax=Plasmodium coatneyi TaxID=208452 RepID=A0A1B1DZ30_9APIC|nr:hypothetical protein PCOAH_00023480 [Plasmodium coatneyi]ANQ08061.1 hypothetical protein PCOAH_00023480 [Plasmodium coatneyi]